MHFKLKNVFIFSFLTAMAGATWYWSRIPAPQPYAEAGRESLPLGFYLQDAEIFASNDDGHLSYRLLAARAEELPNENLLILDNVRVEYQPVENVPWLLTAESGRAPIDQSYFDLIGAVELANNPDDDLERTIIQTEELRFDPQTFVASTEASVKLLIGDRRLDAVGIKVFLRDDRVELESSVHGQFDP
jgi:LPS export ABC transporter protein LptC